MGEVLEQLVEMFMSVLPKLGGALVALLTGLILGKLTGSAISRLGRKMRLDEMLKDSVIHRVLATYNTSVSEFLGTSLKWFIYLSSLLVAMDLLGIPALERFSETAIEYLPSLLGGILILIGGTALAEFLAKLAGEVIADLGAPYSRLLMLFLRFILLSIVITTSLLVMKIDATVLYSMLNALFWGISLGVGAAIGIALGLGLKDYVASSVKTWIETARRMERGQRIREYEDKMKEYGERIRELSEELGRREERIRELEARRREEISEYEKREVDVRSRLHGLIGDTGSLMYARGGYRIVTTDISKFPLTEVLVCLANNGFRVVVERTDKGYVIDARPMRRK
ncbi:MAG: hypothetical protein DRJ43_01850 [Thermoprotei archaeon]|nr:MAG: hypothetical protein DRJ43_01850 [Thermoprotei archaeon]